MERIIRGQWVDPKKLKRAKELRRNMTEAEKLLWYQLKNNQLNGFHFRRQQIIDGFIADFYCHSAKLVIEVDGGVHKDTIEFDRERDKIFKVKGLMVLRVSNKSINDNFSETLKKIATICQQRT